MPVKQDLLACKQLIYLFKREILGFRIEEPDQG
jgi:hypothetical protein